MQTHDDKLEALARQIRELGEILSKQLHPEHKFCLTVEELCQRWILGPEAIRRLVSEKRLKPLRGFKPFRFTFDTCPAFAVRAQFR